MRNFWAFILLWWVSSCIPRSEENSQPLIDFGFDPQSQGISGTESTQWIVKVLGDTRERGRLFCTGSLIKTDMVLTTAHCLANNNKNLTPTNRITVEVLDRRTNQVYSFRVRRTSIHPLYIPDLSLFTPKKFDLGLMELQEPVDPALSGPLPHLVLTKKQLVSHGIPGRPFLFFGYGHTKKPEYTGRLLYGQALSHDPQKCLDVFVKTATDGRGIVPCNNLNDQASLNFFCALTGARSAAIQPGDSGGPALVVSGTNQYLIGVSTSGTDKMAFEFAKNSLFETLDHSRTLEWMHQFSKSRGQTCDSRGCSIQ